MQMSSYANRQPMQTMKKSISFLALIVFSCLMYSCKCDENQQCGTLSQESRDWLPFRENDILTYQNAGGAKYRFTMKTTSASQPYISYGRVGGWLGGCEAETCESSVLIEGIDSSAAPLSISYWLLQGGPRNELEQINYTIGDCSYNIMLPYISTGEKGDYNITVDTVSQLTLGAHTYGNVQVVTQKSSSALTRFRIKKVYVAEHFGVIGFEDSTASLYYLN